VNSKGEDREKKKCAGEDGKGNRGPGVSETDSQGDGMAAGSLRPPVSQGGEKGDRQNVLGAIKPPVCVSDGNEEGICGWGRR